MKLGGHIQSSDSSLPMHTLVPRQVHCLVTLINHLPVPPSPTERILGRSEEAGHLGRWPDQDDSRVGDVERSNGQQHGHRLESIEECLGCEQRI